jgi:hypothetical protein|tara:strand:+ start:2228 stop:2386 length:159 start_codon:yes stop_codon:yes gene_type:complete
MIVVGKLFIWRLQRYKYNLKNQAFEGGATTFNLVLVQFPTAWLRGRLFLKNV